MPIQRYFKSLDKAIAVLKCFTPEKPELKTSEVASKVGIHRVTAHRLLETLAKSNLLHKDINRGIYTIGIELYALGSIYIENNDIYKAATPAVKKINELTEEVVAINVSDSRGGVMLLMREERKTGFRWGAHISSVFPAYASAGGKALLSELTDEEIDSASRGKMPHLTVEERAKNFKEVDLGYTEEIAVREARRCLRCDMGTEDGVKALERLRRQKRLESEIIDTEHIATEKI